MSIYRLSVHLSNTLNEYGTVERNQIPSLQLAFDSLYPRPITITKSNIICVVQARQRTKTRKAVSPFLTWIIFLLKSNSGQGTGFINSYSTFMVNPGA